MYTLTQQDIDSITDPEWAFGTTRLLPEENQIPKQFWDHYTNTSNVYVELADALFTASPPPEGDLVFNSGFDGSAAGQKRFRRMLDAHLRSFEPDHHHKIAGLAYMIAQVVTITKTKPGN